MIYPTEPNMVSFHSCVKLPEVIICWMIVVRLVWLDYADHPLGKQLGIWFVFVGHPKENERVI